jgi:hypothetical protein
VLAADKAVLIQDQYFGLLLLHFRVLFLVLVDNAAFLCEGIPRKRLSIDAARAEKRSEQQEFGSFHRSLQPAELRFDEPPIVDPELFRVGSLAVQPFADHVVHGENERCI